MRDSTIRGPVIRQICYTKDEIEEALVHLYGHPAGWTLYKTEGTPPSVCFYYKEDVSQ